MLAALVDRFKGDGACSVAEEQMTVQNPCLEGRTVHLIHLFPA
ncbi:MAG: hypothetical protein AAGF04_02945 [Chlamydiota bacterium]